MKSDVDLQRDVLEQLDWEPSIDAAQIGVTAHEGVVTLHGHVPTHSDKYTAEKLTKRVHGTKAVANDIDVQLSAPDQIDDEHIAAAAVHTLEWDGKVRHDDLQVVVRDGWIKLEGTVSHRFERDAAERAVRHLKGVHGVTNRIVVDLTATHTEERDLGSRMKSAIEDAIRRNAIVNSGNVTVEVTEQDVILTGDVHSHAEFDEAERLAWSARGVPHVENCLTITPWGSGPIEEWGY